VGENNSKNFHQYANFWKNINTIWEIRSEDGSKAFTFKEKEEEGVCFFQYLFQEPRGCPIQDILRVISKFPAVITEEMNRSLCEEVTEVEVQEALFSMQKGKSPRPNGLTV
jgi:hypothetical protein